MGCCLSRPSKEEATSLRPSIPGFPVIEELSIKVTVAAEEDSSRLEEHGLLLVVEFRLNHWRWRVYRTISDFFTLQLHVGHLGLSFWRLWKLNLESEALVSEEDLRQLQHFLEVVMSDSEKRHNGAFLQFAEISVFSFEESKSIKEGWISKRRGGRQFIAGTVTAGFKHVLHSLKRYSKRWFVLREDHLFYSSSPSSPEVLDVMLLDASTTVQEIRPDRDRDVASGCVWWISGYKYALKVKNAYRTLVLKFPSRPRMLQWKFALDTAIKSVKADVGTSREHSDCQVKVLIDGAEYFEHIALALEAATSDVFIVGWWLTPDLLLIRKDDGEEGHRLMDYLRRAAERGVKIYIVLYSEPSVKLYNDSEFVKATLEELHANVQVLSHPARTGANATLFWSHHQKLVIVDHLIAFVGGIDLCLGRFDRPTHHLHCSGEFQGRDFVNFCIRDFTQGAEVRDVHINEPFIERNVLPRLPWHDVAVRVSGSASFVADLARHFVALWNHVKTDKHKNTGSVRFLKVKASRVKDLRNKIKDIFSKKRKPKVGNFPSTDQEETDEEYPEPPPVESPPPPSPPRRSMIESLSKELSEQADPDDPTSYKPAAVPLPHRSSTLLLPGSTIRQTSAGEPPEVTSEVRPTFTVQARFLRSASWWSFGLPREQTILAAYLSAIREAKKFIYIENQFFVAGVGEAVRATDAHDFIDA